MRFNREQVAEKLKEINKRVLEQMGTPTVEKEAYDKVKFVANEVVNTTTDARLKDEIETALKSGMLDRRVIETQDDKAAEFNRLLGVEIERAIKAGTLPHPGKDPFIQRLNKQWRKQKRR
jgi:excinuclease UvrABC ATPase subunit